MPSNDPLLQPFQLKHLTIRNRLMSTSHEPAYSEDGMPKDRYRLYHEEKAKGGIGLTCIGGSAIIARDSPPAFGNLLLYDDAIIPWLNELSDGVHGHGAAVFCQITHLGRRSSNTTGDWLPLVAPSPLREPAHRAFPKEAEDFDLKRIIKAYGAAAKRCQSGGLDGIEIEAYGHFLDGFWSPATNQREDGYGGSLDHRLRLTFDVIDEIRRQVGPEFILGFRLVADERMSSGLERHEGLEIAKRLADSGQVDFLNVIQGHIDTDEGLSHVIPGMGTPAAPHLDLVSAIKAATDIPVFHAARINDVATARHAVAGGHLDMVGMTRAHMADPHIGVKIMRGEEERIRPCVGVGYCIDRIYYGEDALCIHSPATGREQSMPHTILPSQDDPKTVVVIGAGPAGLEAARVSAQRGHRVILFEAAAEHGGQLRIAAKLGRRKEIIGIADWLYGEVERLGVDLNFNVYAERDEVLAANPDVVVIATGGLPNTDFLRHGNDLVVTSWDILSGDVAPAQSILMFDDNGAHPGMSCTEFLAGTGASIELVTPERSLAPDVGGTNYPAYFKACHQAGVTFTLNRRLQAVQQDGNRLNASLYDEYTGSSEQRVVDQVVVEHGTLPLDELYFDLKSDSINLGEIDYDALINGHPQTLSNNDKGKFQLFRVGDSVTSRNIHTAIYDSLRLCKNF